MAAKIVVARLMKLIASHREFSEGRLGLAVMSAPCSRYRQALLMLLRNAPGCLGNAVRFPQGPRSSCIAISYWLYVDLSYFHRAVFLSSLRMDGSVGVLNRIIEQSGRICAVSSRAGCRLVTSASGPWHSPISIQPSRSRSSRKILPYTHT